MQTALSKNFVSQSELDARQNSEGSTSDDGKLQENTNNHDEASSARRFSPPPTPPHLPSDSVMVTPLRPSQSNSSKFDFKTPSPPKGLPELPDPPSSSDEVDSDRTPPVRTPENTVYRRRTAADVKTPRPPGAWATPYSVVKVKTLPPGGESPSHATNDLHTPPPSFSRATSLPLQTPAPPGAWLHTPYAGKKSAQKVRFDEKRDKDNSVISSHNPAEELGQHGRPPYDESSSMNGSHLPTEQPILAAKPSSPPRSQRSSGVRQVDAFGKEIANSANHMDNAQHNVDESHRVETNRRDLSSARKNRFRVVDAMGREIEESMSDIVGENNSARSEVGSIVHDLENLNLERKQAQELMQKTIAGLQNDLARFDVYVSSLLLFCGTVSLNSNTQNTKFF